ncbi:MAG: MFS transporter [Solirubrobacteraceae bacterium]
MLLAYSVNEVGTWFGYVALAVAVYDATHSVIATAALYVARGLLPALLSPLLVARMERSRRRAPLALAFFVEGLLTLGLAAVIWRFWLPGVLALVAIDGIAAVTNTALVRATGVRIAEREEEGEAAQRRATASLNIAFMVAFAVGPAIGGILVKSVGGPLAVVADAVSFLLCSLILYDFNLEAEGGDESRSRVLAAWRHITGLPALRLLLGVEAIALVFFNSVEAIEVIYVKRALHSGDFGLGLLLGLWGAGAALGAVVFARAISASLAVLLTVGTLLVGLAYLGYGVAPTLALASIAAVVGGVGNGVHWPAFLSSVQRLTPSHLQGQVMGAVGSLGVLCPSFGYAVGGLITALSDTRVAMLLAGGVATASTAVFVRIAMLSLGVAAVPEPPVVERAGEDATVG